MREDYAARRRIGDMNFPTRCHFLEIIQLGGECGVQLDVGGGCMPPAVSGSIDDIIAFQ
jgi:hypothetical protein